jgi:hypothetical protein
MRNVVLMIPDAGPLISLAKGNALDTLLILGLPIWIVDQVYFEVTRDTGRNDAAAIRAFVENQELVNVFETQVGSFAAMAREKDPAVRQKGLGEAAIAEFYTRVDEVVSPLDPILILFEDSDMKRINAIVQGNVHLLTTRAFLNGLERRGLIGSANEIWDEINSAGRSPSEVEIDQPAPATYGGSRW